MFYDADLNLDINKSLIVGLPDWVNVDYTNFESGEISLSGIPSESDIGLSAVDVTIFDDTNLSSVISFDLEVFVTNFAPVLTESNVTITMTEDEPSSWNWDVSLQSIFKEEETSHEKLLWEIYQPSSYGSQSISSDGSNLSYSPQDDFFGTDSFIIKVNDLGYPEGNSSNAKFDLLRIDVIVEEVADDPYFLTSPITLWDDESLYVYNFEINDVDTELENLEFNCSLPEWLNFEYDQNGTGIIYGLANYKDEGIHEVSLRVSDGRGIIEQKFNLNLVVNDYPPVFQMIGGRATLEQISPRSFGRYQVR